MEDQSVKKSSRRIFAGGIIIVIAVAVGVVLLLLRQKESVAAEREDRVRKLLAGPAVKVVKAEMNKGGREFTLIGEVRPFQSVTLYAKTSGYLEQILVDKGDRVTKGQLLATIIAPEIDQDYSAAKADLENKKKILARDQSLLEKNYISFQDKEQSETAVKVAEARLTSIESQQQYRSLRAPFNGTITARYADAGALMQNATNASTGALPVVMISQLDKVRIYVYVEQKDASYLRKGYPVKLSLFETPEVKMNATITRISGELDPRTRMMLTEIDMDNTDQKVIPGSFIQVSLQAPGAPRLQVPREALVIRGSKYFVTSLATDSTIHFKEVKIGENTGDFIVVLDGVEEGETLALNIGESMEEGQKVTVKP
ncbi:MAG: hypothetical protein DI538_17705 [Azospira oryzae]|jgi:membrane fusion protein (multidrug efflux system)|nr:MAG: hypothetical protein DI538_17705 [Azospira oryzae]